MDVTGEIQAHLKKAMELSVAAGNNRTGNYATFVMTWQRYYGTPENLT